jgi:Baseplate J-like protein
MTDDCSQNFDSLKLVREGTSQDGRVLDALDPAYAPANGRSVPYSIVFARSYAQLLKYFDATDTAAGDWSAFFGGDVSVPLAVAAIEDVETYKTYMRSWFDFLNDLANHSKDPALRDRLGYLYAGIATLAYALDDLKQTLPAEIPLRGTIQNLIKSQLAPAFGRLIAYYKGGNALGVVNAVVPSPPVQILRRPAVSFADVLSRGLSDDWSGGVAWNTYTAGIGAEQSVYGTGSGVFAQVNHCSTHNLFKSVFDQFLKVFVRVIGDAKQALAGTLTDWDRHEPHYALFLAFLQLFEYARASGNTLTQRHLDFYYRTILGLKEKPAEPGHVLLLAELAKQATSRDFPPGELLKAGKDSQGKDAFFANVHDFVANQAKVAALKSVYRHGSEPVGGSNLHNGRIFASPVANSDDGLGAALTSTDRSWHPFFNKTYVDGELAKIRMPEADIGFAVASHYLLMAEGSRLIIVEMKVGGYTGAIGAEFKDDIRCFLTTEKGWLEKPASVFVSSAADTFQLWLEISGADAAIVPYAAKVHGYTFQTDLPMLLVKLKQDDTRAYGYSKLQGVSLTGVKLCVFADKIKSLAISNDFGPVDPSKPFQPFGSSPVNGSSLVIGSKEIFQKNLLLAWINLEWLIAPSIYPNSSPVPTVTIDFLNAGQWSPTNITVSVAATGFYLNSGLDKPVLDQPDFSANEFYNTQSRQGFVRLRLTGGFGQDDYQTALINYLKGTSSTNPGKPPVGPTASAISMGYWSSSTLALNSSALDAYRQRAGQFFHLAPFGTAEQHPYLSGGGTVHLLPQFAFERDNATLTSEAEFYIGVAGLVPPQNLSLLFQVVDGTANPLAAKPEPHIDWCYLRNNQWIELGRTAVQDGTDELLAAGIATLAIPSDATSDNTLLPSGQFWIRAAVHEKSDAVCKLQLIAAQAMEAAFADRNNAPNFSTTPLPAGTVTKLVNPDSAVKGISQPYPSFGGRGAEQSGAFYTRVSERLRHKDRAIDLWDYEHLILEAFPQVYKVKCLNHTCFEPNDTGTGIYRELAPGHVTIVTIPNLHAQQQRDPLKPYTSLGVLQEIEAFLRKRTSCFAQLHVKNPQFEEVRVRFALRLYDGYDETYYTLLLKQAITRFLSPWAFTEQGTPSFGGRIYKSALINFVEEQPYVDYVTDFQVFQDVAGVKGTVDLDEVAGSKAVSILVSAPASKHDISIINPAQDSQLAETCGCDA